MTFRARVIVPPEPIVQPSDIAGNHAEDDAGVAALIAAVTERMDGPGGFLGRSFGVQALLATGPAFCPVIKLPAGPVIDVVSFTYLDPDGEERQLDDAAWRLADDCIWLGSSFGIPPTMPAPDAVRIEYNAGYDDEKTGALPERARAAIIISVQHLASLAVENLYRRVDEVEGVGRQEFTLSEQATNVVERACRSLLGTLWVPAL